MQNLDKFKVHNFNKQVLSMQRARQSALIYAFNNQDSSDKNLPEPRQGQDDIDKDFSNEQTQTVDATEQKPIVAPMPGNSFSFLDEVENVLQSFIQAEHLANTLMPTINCQIPSLKESDFKKYRHSRVFQDIYDETAQESAENQSAPSSSFEKNSRSNLKKSHYEEKKSGDLLKSKRAPQASSLMLVQGSYDSRFEKLELLEKQRRKVYQEQETGLELQDLYRINDSQMVKKGETQHGRATHKNEHQSKLRVYLSPQVYSKRVFEEWMGQNANFNSDHKYMKDFLSFFKQNPFAAAKLLHGIATDAFNNKNEEFQNQTKEFQEKWENYYGDDEETNTKMTWGNFLPDRVRQLILNLSRYYLDNLLAADSLDPSLASEKFFFVFKILIQYSSQDELFESLAPQQLHWHFLQVIKVLFEGQARSHSALATLIKIFQPVYSCIGASTLRKKLTSLTQVNSSFLRQQEADDENIVDKFRSKLFDPNPNYSFCNENIYERQKSEDISGDGDLNQLLKSKISTDNKTNFHDTKMPTQIDRDMLKMLSRVMPEPVLDFEKTLLEPLTSVFADFQAHYNSQDFNKDTNLKTLPDCNVFTFEVVSTNMLMVDIYAPKNRIQYAAQQPAEEVEQIRPEQSASELRSLMTQKVINICTNILDSLGALHTEIPLKLKLMIRLILDKGKTQPGTYISETDAYLIADFLAGTWLSNAFRWPECLGMEPAFREEALTLGHLLTASRLVLETCLACQTLPLPKIGHRTYCISDLNAFIQSKKEKVLAFYNAVFGAVDPNFIQLPSYKELQKQGPTKPNPPKEILEANLMRVADLAILIKLVQWQFNAHWGLFSVFELNFDFGDGKPIMVKDNPPSVIKNRIENANKEILKNQGRKQPKNKFSKKQDLQTVLQFWEAKFEKYQELHEKPNRPFSFDLEWQFIGYEYQCTLDDSDVIKLFLSEELLQSHLFRIHRQPDRSQKRACLKFRDEIFEDQFISLLSSQKYEGFDNDIKSEKKKNRKKQFLAYVEQYFDPKSDHNRLKEPTKHRLLFGRGKNALETIEESSEASFMELNSVDEAHLMDISSQSDNYHLDVSEELKEEEKTISAQTYITKAQNGPNEAKHSSQVVLPTKEEIKSDPVMTIKMQYVDAIERVFYHLRGAIDQPNFLTEKIIQRIQIARGSSEDEMFGGQMMEAEQDLTFDLEEIFKYVLEDDRLQPDQSMKLQLDAFLIKRYFSKLEQPMQDNLMELLKQRLTFVIKMMEFNFERQNHKYDRVRKFMNYLQTVTDKRVSVFEIIYNTLKVNRFICKSWSFKQTINKEELNQMIRDVYFAEAQEIRNMHNQTEIFAQSSDRQSTLIRSVDLSARNKRRGTQRIEEMTREDFLEEQSQLKQIHDSTLKSSMSSQIFNLQEKSGLLDLRTSMTGSFLITENKVLLDINILSSNLIYVATVVNYEFVKKQIREADLKGLFVLSEMMDSSDDRFLIKDLYKTYLFCVKHVLILGNLSSKENLNHSQEEFLVKIQDVFYQQLIQRVWDQLKDDPDMLTRDLQIKDYFRLKKDQNKNLITQIETDLDAIDLSSEEESESDAEGQNGLSQIYEIAIETLLTLNQTNQIDQKAMIVEKSIWTAVRAYKQSTILSQSKKNVSPETLNQILEHVIQNCYLRDPHFSLHLNMTFIIMTMFKRSDSSYGIQQVSKYLGTISKAIDEQVGDLQRRHNSQ